MSKLDVALRETQGVCVLQLDGDADAHTAISLESMFERLVAEKKFNILVNCKDLRYISSAGLGVFMAFIETVRANQGDIRLSNIPRKTYQIFEMFGFPSLFKIFEDEGQAVESFLTVR